MKIIAIFLIYLCLFSCEETTNKTDQNYSDEQVDNSEYLEIEEPRPHLNNLNGPIVLSTSMTLLKQLSRKIL